MNEEKELHVQVTPEELVNDFLIGGFELEKLKNGFQAPVVEGPCADPQQETK